MIVSFFTLVCSVKKLFDEGKVKIKLRYLKLITTFSLSQVMVLRSAGLWFHHLSSSRNAKKPSGESAGKRIETALICPSEPQHGEAQHNRNKPSIEVASQVISLVGLLWIFMSGDPNMLRFGTASQIRPDLSSRVENYWLDLLILSIRIKITKYKLKLFRPSNDSLYLG